jgi:hypothetical protein
MGQLCPETITIKLNYDRKALASVINNDRKVCSKLKRNLQSYKTFVVQATESGYI